MRSKLGVIQKQKSQIRAAIQKSKRKAVVVMSDIEKVDGRLSSLSEQMEQTRSSLGSAKAEQTRLRSELEKATIRLAERRGEVQKRLRWMYLRQESSVVGTLARSRNLGDLASRKSMLERIARKDRSLFDEVARLQRQIGRQTLRQDQLVSEVAGLERRQQGEQLDLRDARQTKQQYLGELQSQQAELRKQYDELEQESSALATQIRAYQATRRRSGKAVTPWLGSFAKPAGGPITSPFGVRFHPILRERRMHMGVDIGARYGTPIVAAAPGVVITAQYTRGYGNMVIIDHGGNLSTLYAHSSRLLVRSGQRVTRGQQIAAVGSTGLSTGPHLHFEVRSSGRPVNPLGRF